MVFIKNFRSTSIWKAFVLNSIAGTLTIYIAINVKSYLDKKHITNRNNVSKGVSNVLNNMLILLVTFSTSLISYFIMYIVFGFGSGMLSNS